MAPDDELSARARSALGCTLKGKWTLDSVLGVGGMATVYAATHRNRKRAAVKLLHPEIASQPGVPERFLREGYAANSVGHPGVVSVFDDDVTAEGVPFLVMDLLVGETLEHRWERKGKCLPIAEVVSLIDGLLDVLTAAHAKGIVHRDIKPENLMLTVEGQLKVLDFGIARLRELSQSGIGATLAGSLLGTPAFMAPEQALGHAQQIDAQTDLWSVGATAYTLFTGRYVHEGSTVNEQLVMAASVAAKPIATIAPQLPPAIAAWVDKALRRDKAGRFKDSSEMRKALLAAYGEPFASLSTLSVDVPARANPEGAAETIAAVSVGSVDDSFARTTKRDRAGRARSRVVLLSAVAATSLAGLAFWGLFGQAGEGAAATDSLDATEVPAAGSAPNLRANVPNVTPTTGKAAPGADAGVKVTPAVQPKKRLIKRPIRPTPQVHTNPKPNPPQNDTKSLVPAGDPPRNPFDRRH